MFFVIFTERFFCFCFCFFGKCWGRPGEAGGALRRHAVAQDVQETPVGPGDARAQGQPDAQKGLADARALVARLLGAQNRRQVRS